MHPPPPPSRRHHTEEIKDILEDEIISTADGGYQRYLVRWRRLPESNITWLQAEEIMQPSLDLLGDYHLRHSPEANVRNWGELMGILQGLERHSFAGDIRLESKSFVDIFICFRLYFIVFKVLFVSARVVHLVIRTCRTSGLVCWR